MYRQSFYIFKKKCFGLFSTDYFCNIKKQSTARFLKTATLACQRKCLARETGTKYIEIIRYVLFCFFFRYISEWNFTEIGKVCFFCLFVPFRRKNALPAQILKCYSKSANSCKKVYK